LQTVRARLDMEWPEGLENEAEPAQASNSVRSWLVHGTNGFGPSRRRGRARNALARQLLAADSGWLPGDRSGWRGLVTALQRHSVLGALSELHRSDRQILTMAYLQGHTNVEIARMLRVSARTVSRRLGVALGRLETHARNAGIWIASLLLVALAFLNKPQERVMNLVRSVQWQQAASVAVASAAVVALGLPSGAPVISQAQESRFAPSGHSVVATLPAATVSNPTAPVVTAPAPAVVLTAAPAPLTVTHQSTPQNSENVPQGCGPAPVNAPPATPVQNHHAGRPVDIPGPRALGCKSQ